MRKISVIMPCYNAAEYLQHSVESILQQTIGMENIEIIMVDDASTDRGATLEIMMSYEKKYPENIMVIPLEQNMRQGGARNVGITYATGEYMIFCDADDCLAKVALERLYRVAVRHDADVVEFRAKNISDYDEITDKVQSGGQDYLIDIDTVDKRKEIIQLSMDNFSLGCLRKLYRTSLIQNNQIRFAEHLICEEPSFTLPVRFYEKRHYFLDEELYHYYLSPNSTMRSNWGERQWDNMQVWLILLQDLGQRGLLQQYYAEIESMFFDWCYRLSIAMMHQRGQLLTADGLELLKNTVLKVFPNVRENKYLADEKGQKLLKTFDLDYNRMDIHEMNRVIKEAMN